MMMEVIREWYRRNFTDPQTVILALLLIFGFTAILFFGRIMAPVLAGVVIAYLLDGPVTKLSKLGVPRLIGTSITLSLFMAFILVLTFGLMPLMSQQVTQLVRELPQMIGRGRELLMQLPELYPNFVSEQQINELISAIGGEIAGLGQKVVSMSLSSVVGFITFLVYLILVPLMVFFFLKDKELIIRWATSLLPEKRGLATEVWRDLNFKIAAYVRGKFIEILIIWVMCYVAFTLLGLEYAMLLAFLVGLSVIIPYVGAMVVTIPVALIGYFQWGWGSDFLWLLVVYGAIQFFDGNLLVPLLFSEVVNLHPVAIIVAVLFFGGLWGLWGVFFAIPLATLIQAVLKAWPRIPSSVSGEQRGAEHEEPSDTAGVQPPP
jgi:putative permease